MQRTNTLLDEITQELRKFLYEKKKPLKHHLLGLETEFMILDSNGHISNSADEVLKKAKNVAKKECAKNMIEIAAFPSKTIAGTMHDMLDRTQSLLDIMEKTGHNLYFCGTYPGKFNPLMRREDAYHIKEKIFGENKFRIAGRCIGFHCHYTLPRGVFDKISKRLKMFVKSKISHSMISSYNMLIAMDPVLATFAQSSPFYQGRLYGKDSRIMFYRGSRIFGVDGLYTGFQDFGGLPHYKHTLDDILHLAEDMSREWMLLMKRLEINVKTLALYGSVLETNWSPVKINPLGTFEMRGMDMNRFETLSSLAVCMRFALKYIHENYTSVVDSDIAIREPFRIEGEKIYIPPYSYMNNVLQRESALYGMDSPNIRQYCSRFLNFSAKTLPSDRKKFLKPLRDMIQKRRTFSDDIILGARKMGYNDSIPPDAAAELSLKITQGIQNDIDKTRKLVSGLLE